jgi:hypothetical protein
MHPELCWLSTLEMYVLCADTLYLLAGRTQVMKRSAHAHPGKHLQQCSAVDEDTRQWGHFRY